MSTQQDDSMRGNGAHGSPETIYMERSSADSVDADTVEMTRSAARSIKTGSVTMERSAVASLHADVAELKYSAAALTYARERADLSWASPTVVGARGDVTLKNGAAQIVAAGNNVGIRSSAAVAVVARTARVEGGLVGVLLAGQADVDEKARVLLKPAGAAAAGAGFAGGLVVAFAFLWKAFSAAGKRRRRTAKND